MPGSELGACYIHAHGRAPTCFIRSNNCVCISPVCDERDNVAISKLTRRYRIYESLEVRAKARGHDQNTTWRLFRPGHSRGCDDGIEGSSDKYVYKSLFQFSVSEVFFVARVVT